MGGVEHYDLKMHRLAEFKPQEWIVGQDDSRQQPRRKMRGRAHSLRPKPLTSAARAARRFLVTVRA